uniref:Uncharacterized protein n=1 Tax=Coccidioides posadasii RMSCC 3488 TaxID=454284 RepID=A0A0J6FMK1_COCPO|nr:hypothetical protein CPAG_06411 [Coccidioides posadasii RMSCC 3488]
MSHQGQEDGEAGASSVDIPTSPIFHGRQLDYDESSRPPSSSTQFSTVDTHPTVKCLWCPEEFRANPDDPAKTLKLHMQSAHPDVTSHSEHIASEDTSVAENMLQESDQTRQPRQLSNSQGAMGVDERMLFGWKIHDVRSFTKDYHGEKDDLESMWKKSFDGFDRPKPYETEQAAPGNFLPITDPDIYVDLLKDPNSHSTEELYAITANAAKALEVWQDEYLAVDELSKWATRRVLKKTADPRKTEEFEVFEDKKEARLYGYKHDSRPSKVGLQNPFLQGGFKPTADQMKRMAAAATDPYNVDGWEMVVKDGVEYVPRIRPLPPPEPKRKNNSNGKTENGRNGQKRVTRYGGSRHPATREPSQALTERSSPTPSTRTQSPEAAATPSSYTVRSRRKTRSSARTRTSGTQGQSGGKTTRSQVAKPSALGPNRARAAPTSAPPTAIGTTATTPTSRSTPAPATVYDDPLLDPKNQEKIKMSKHPKRTEAMIRHWAKFNSEGRTRNPKRTKAQIEADKAAAAAEAAQRAPSGRKRKTETEGEEATTGASTPIPKKTRRPAAKLKAASESRSPAPIPAMQPMGVMAPPSGLPEVKRVDDSPFSTPMHNGQ